MSHFIVKIFITMLLTAIITSSNAGRPTILDTSVNWSDDNSVHRLLSSAPEWNNATIKSLFTIYKHPEHHQLPNFTDDHEYDIQFINAFWGPLKNPFTKYPRPAKAFVFVNKQIENYYLVPLIKNSDDGNYYIFDKHQSQPILLSTWIKQIQAVHGQQIALRFNLCNHYGNFPLDSCTETSYQKEAVDAVQEKISSVNVMSEHRNINEDWKTKIPLKARPNNDIYDTRVAWNDENAKKQLLKSIVSWPNYTVIKDNFKKIRDLRYFTDPIYSDFQRRISWLFPDDGCWSRTSTSIKDFFGPLNNEINYFPRPSKIFAFGNLCVNTTNSPQGAVAWWYHTVPIVKDAETNQLYVFDPAINPNAPLTLANWITEMTPTSGRCARLENQIEEFNICNGYGSSPSDICNDKYRTETRDMLFQLSYQEEEWERQIQLNRDPKMVLGNNPPWNN